MKDIKNSIIEILKQCNDPELPIDLWNLGLIYDLKIYEQPKNKFGVDITMSLTTPGCSMGQYMIEDIKSKIATLEHMTNVNVEITFDPPWSPEMMTEEGKQKLGF
jgi:metal-sulfur cluster biosynthetic enzyme